MNRLNIIKTLSFTVITVSLLVIVGWVFDIAILKSIYPTWVAMKFITAAAFLLSGLILYLIAKTREGWVIAKEILPLPAVIIFLLMATLLVSAVFGIHTGIEDLFVRENVGAVMTIIPGSPAILTMIAFILIAVSGFLCHVNYGKFRKIFIVLGGIVAAIGTIAMVGYILQIPVLYYYIPDKSGAIAVNTSVLFIIIGISLTLLGQASLEESKKVFKITIKSRLTLAFLTIGLVSTLFLGFISISSSGNAIEKEVSSKLFLLAEAKEGQIYAYFDSLESRTIDFSSDGFIRDNLKEIVRTGSKQAVATLNNHLIVDKKSLDPTLLGISVVDAKGKVVAATDEEEIGGDESQDEYFQEGLKGVFTKELEEHEHFDWKYVLVVAAPLTDKDTGELLGVLFNFFNEDKLASILSGQFQIEKGALSSEKERTKTLEAYLVNQKKKMFVYSEVGKHEYTSQTIVDTAWVRGCLDNGQEMVGKFPNYAGEEVIGASMCFPQRGWTLVVEITTQEVYAPLRSVQFGLAIITIIILLFIIIDALVVANRISQPIKILHEGTEKIAQGNLDYQVEVKTGDEIEQLARAFNEMTANLKESHQKFESRVQERTKDLASKTEELERMNKLMVGRELKMAELKKELKELKGKI